MVFKEMDHYLEVFLLHYALVFTPLVFVPNTNLVWCSFSAPKIWWYLLSLESFFFPILHYNTLPMPLNPTFLGTLWHAYFCLSFAALGTGLMWHQFCSQEIKISLLLGTISTAPGHRNVDLCLSRCLSMWFLVQRVFCDNLSQVDVSQLLFLSFLIALLDFWQSYSSIKLDSPSIHVAFVCCPASFPCLASSLSSTFSSFPFSIPLFPWSCLSC